MAVILTIGQRENAQLWRERKGPWLKHHSGRNLTRKIPKLPKNVQLLPPMNWATGRALAPRQRQSRALRWMIAY